MIKNLEIEIVWKTKTKKEKLRNYLPLSAAKKFIEYLINDQNVVLFEWKKV